MDQRTNYLSLILLDALEDENESDINFILERNSKAIDPSYVPQDRGIAPLHYVCGMQNKQLAIDVTKRFLSMGVDPNCRSEDNMTPLHVAAMYGREEIVRLLLEHGAELEVYDNDRKTPVLYAIDECNFEVVQIMKDHIFLKKYEKKKANNTTILTESRFENSLHQRAINNKGTTSSTPQRTPNKKDEPAMAKNKNLLKVTSSLDESFGQGSENNKYTPNRINYNYDVTSPYYINITHRRHKPQPKFPDHPPVNTEETNIREERHSIDDVLSISMQNVNLSSPEPPEPVNIFSLTQENLKELTQRTASCERSRLSLIETWREKVQKSRARQSILKQFDDIVEMIDQVVENDHLNFTNTELKEKSPLKETKQPPDIEVDSGACASTSSSLIDTTEYHNLPTYNKKYENKKVPERKTPTKPQMSLSKLIQTVAEAKELDFEENHLQIPDTPSPSQQNADLESSYQTVPEIVIGSPDDNHQEAKEHNTTTNFIRSPKNNEYYLQMTEAYVHTDDENGLVFYETKLLSNVGNKQAQQRKHCTPKTPGRDLDSTMTSQSTNLTIPLDYDTDALRAELTAFGEPPGPITKTTKKLYIKKLIKCKRHTTSIPHTKENEIKFSVELERTLKSEENFQRIKDYIKYETQSMEYFEGNINKKQMREGHLKQSFIYMLIDPRISCNLPGESVFLNEFDVWQRFLKSIFYVGKGKTSRPFSHLYDAMKIHSRLHNKDAPVETDKNGKKISIKKQPLNVEIFKSPPQKKLDSKKIDRILNIWANGKGVVCLNVFHNILPVDAFTREAAIIDALGIQHLTNCKRGDYYGPSKTWTMKEKKYLGIALLFKAMRMYLAEGESQLSPSDLI
ncbi:uncharacterized protein LOC111686697 [Lucilia cuprina]|uniref:uncharacterized protein LOC111686697 n=1 Tax=Lucilia cuprina TaxID=7375 RepID=UPI001F06F9F3|nr:uncharacterized protein LOC111686697 [Lucilia cuprina]